MSKFKIKAFVVEEYNEEIEAENEEKAKEFFEKRWSQREIESEEAILFFEGDEGFEIIKDFVDYEI